MTDAELSELLSDILYRLTVLESVVNGLAPTMKEYADQYMTRQYLARFGRQRADDDAPEVEHG